MLTIILPVKQSWVKPDCFIRLIINLIRLKRQKKILRFNVLVADTSVLPIRFLMHGITALFGFCFFSPLSFKGRTKYYTPAVIKNEAAKFVFQTTTSSSIFFLDVDVLLPDDTLKDLIIKDTNKVPFYWYPVDFMNKNYSLSAMLQACKKNHQLEYPHQCFIQTGYVTGAQLIGKEFFTQTKGYDENFIGYGGEDIEYIHRASYFTGIRPLFSENAPYFTDDRGYDLSQLKGFRNFYYQLKQNDNLDRNLFPKHFWHKRKNKSNYLKNRSENDLKMIQAMKEFDNLHINSSTN